MTTTTVLTDSKYTKLAADLRRLIEESKAQVERVARQAVIELYWAVGKRIAEEELTHQAGYQAAVIEQLAQDLELPVVTLKQSLSFFRAYKFGTPRGTNLTWSHYRALAALPNGEERAWYERQANVEGWDRDRLVNAIRKDAYGETTREGKRAERSQATLKRPTSPAYVYQAEVVRVIDGDTVILNIDLGFQVWKEQRVRLAHIDAPALTEKGGREARDFVLRRLAQAVRIAVKTNKVDIYGRYVADLFYSLEEAHLDTVFLKGRYLNQELVAKGLAKRL